MPHQTLRRSIAIPRQLLDDLLSSAPPELKNNVNRLILTSVEQYVSRRKAAAFEDAMSRMASDPAIRSESAAISAEFSATEWDGLSRD